MTKRQPLSFNIEKKTVPANIQESEPTKQRQSKSKGREGRQFIAAHVAPEAAKQFKLLSVQQEKTVQSLMIEAINDLFAKYGKSRIADE